MPKMPKVQESLRSIYYTQDMIKFENFEIKIKIDIIP
jgi:hypothetical protein